MPTRKMNNRKIVKVPAALEAAARNADKDDLPSLYGYDGVATYCTEQQGVHITRRYVIEATARNELRSFIVAKRLRYSPNDVKTWLLGMRR